MFNPCGDMAEALTPFLRTNGFPGAQMGDICLSSTESAVSTALPIAANKSASAAALMLSSAAAADMPFLYGAPLLQSVRAKNGHLLFEFTAEAYSAIVSAAIVSLPPAVQRDPLTAHGFAIGKLESLARKSGKGCPDDRLAQRAVWRAAEALAYSNDHRRTRLRTEEAIRAALRVLPSRPLEERAPFAAQLGEFAEATARMISAALILGGIIV